MPAIALESWMDSTAKHLDAWNWAAHGYELVAPRVHVKGRMALIVLAAVLWAFLWLLWRAYTVIQTPNDDLVDKLGLDIPPEPLVTLEEIASRQLTVTWKPAEQSTSIAEHQIELNAKIIGSTRKHETTARIINLTPGTLYDLRIFSVSPGRFQTPSAFLHIRTTPDHGSTADIAPSGPPAVQGVVSKLPSISTSGVAPAMIRDNSGGQPISRRGTNARRPSPGNLPGSSDDKPSDDDLNENLNELSQQNQRIRQETESINQQTEDEAKEFEAALKEREAKLHAVKQEMRERDEASGDLRKQVNRAEAQNRSLQSERSKKEKALKDMENRRKRRKDEISKWADRAQSILEEIDGINKQKEAIRRRAESEVNEIKEKNAEEQKEIQALQDDNNEKAIQLKELQEERKRNNMDEETEESREAERQDHARDARHYQTVNTLKQQYHMTQQDYARAQQDLLLARQRMAMHETARRATAVTFAPLQPIDFARPEKQVRRPRHTSSQGSSVSSPRAMFSPEQYESTHQAVTNPTISSRLRNQLFNPMNGMTLPLAIPPPPEEDDEDLLLALPMSPQADALLPHDLLGDESADEFIGDDEDDEDDDSAEHEVTSPFPTLETSNMRRDESSPESVSPDAESSPRSFASPREDFNQASDNPQTSPPPEHKDTGAPQGSAHKRMSSLNNFFGINRQRGKTASDQSPALGSLKNSQTQSLPRREQDVDFSKMPQRRLSYVDDPAWAFPGKAFVNLEDEAESKLSKPMSSMRRAFPSLLGRSSQATRNYDPFAPRTNSFDPGMRGGTSSPRPGSVYSFDKMPRPSMEDTFRAWAFDRPGARNSPLVPDWASSISRSHSRRPSVGYGSTTNLSLHMPEDAEFIEPKRDHRPLQAPIGTRPASSSQANLPQPVTPKLNPAAPSFNTMWTFGKNKDKNKDKPKTKEGKSAEAQEGMSPPESRKSRDGHSIAATTSTFESRESLERTPSAIGAASLDSTPAARPSFISKISRKASSNKFGSWKDKSSNLFSSSRKDPSTPTGETDDDNHNTPGMSGSAEQLGRSLESTSSTPGPEDKKGSRTSLGGWSFMRKKPRGPGLKEDLTASEISENSEFMVSESGTEDRDDESVKQTHSREG